MAYVIEGNFYRSRKALLVAGFVLPKFTPGIITYIYPMGEFREKLKKVSLKAKVLAVIGGAAIGVIIGFGVNYLIHL